MYIAYFVVMWESSCPPKYKRNH